MSLREELNRAIDAADHYDRHGVMPTWARMALTKFVGNHGQALLDALEDAERLDELELSQRADVYWHENGEQELAGYEWGCGGQYSTARDALDAAITARRNTSDQATDAAIKGDG